MIRITQARSWGQFLVVLLILCLPGIASADDYVGGVPLTTVQKGTVTGDLWMDINPAPNWGSQNVVKTFSLPEEAIGHITWARLYVSAYCGHMQNAYEFRMTNSFDGDGISGYEQVWSEPNYETFTYIANGGNDNSEFTGHFDGEPYLMINDHETRVTSDYFATYNVTNLITSQTVNVNVNTTGSFDGRIKVISLVVAYDDPTSTTTTRYWVNQGHDVCSYYTEDNFGTAAVGTTEFSTSDLSGVDIDSATLTIDYMASNNGYYGFPTADNTFVVTGGTPPVTGTFADGLDRTPDVQGAYSGVDSWDVTNDVDGSIDTTFAYSRYFPATGTAAFYKIPLAILVVKAAPAAVTAPVAAYSGSPVSGDSPLTVVFTDTSTGDITNRVWDFGDGNSTWSTTATTVPHTYATGGNYTVNLTVAGPGGSDSEIKTNYITAKCNLFIQGVLNPQGSTVFTNEPNKLIISLVKNNVGNSPATEILVTASDGWSGRAPVTAMGPTGSQSVTITDPTIRTASGTVTYTYKIDPDNVVPETDETTNQQKTISKSVTPNGYKGNQYWPGKEDIQTYLTYDIHGDIIHSFGDSAYRSGSFGDGWTSYDVTWTAGNLTIPAGATIREARLYVPYTWDNSNEASLVTITFNGQVIPRVRTPWEMDQSNFGAYIDHWYGLMTYNVTDQFVKNGVNTATLSRVNNLAKFSPAGLTLMVVYEDPSTSRKQIFVNEGWDLLGASEADYATTEAEATSYQEFTGMTIDMASADNAMLTTFVPWGAPQDPANPGEGNLYINGQKIGSYVWSYGAETTGEGDSPQVAVDVRDILSNLNPGGTGNVIGIQSTAGATPCMVAERSFLVVEYPLGPPVAAFVANTTSGTAPLTVQFTDQSTGSVTTYAWDFTNDGIVDSTTKNATFTYSSAGTYTVNHTVTGPGGSDSEVKSSYITVNAPQSAPTAQFTANTTSGTAPLTVQFTDQSTNSPTGWAWDFENDGVVDSTAQDPTHQYTTAGSYTIKLTATNAGGSDDEVKTDYITVTDGSSVTLSLVPSTQSFQAGESREYRIVLDRVPNGLAGYNLVVTLTNASVAEISEVTYPSWGQLTLTPPLPNSTATLQATDTNQEVVPGATDVLLATLTLKGLSAGTTMIGMRVGEMSRDFGGLPITPLVMNGTAVIGSTTVPVAQFTANTTSGTAPLSVQFTDQSTGTVTTYAWDFTNDGVIDSTAKNATFTYPSAGTYTVNHTVTGPGGSDSEVKSSYITVNATPGAPVAQFTANTTSGTAPLTVQFTDTSTGNISSYAWDFTNDGTIDNTAKNATFTYASAGTYTVNHTVTGPGGSDSEVKSSYITVNAAPGAPTAAFTANTTSGTAPLTVQFTDLSTGNITSYAWDFTNDGIVDSTAKNASFTYSSAGTYTVNHTVTGPGGSDSEVKASYITVNAAPGAPVANFTANTTSGTAPLTVQFTDQSTGSVTTYAWDFTNDGIVDSTAKDASFTYSSAGTYTVNHTVTGPGGSDSEVKASYITVNAAPGAPTAAFTANITSGTAPLSVQFTDQSTGSVTTYAWDFTNDGTVDSTAKNATFTYSSAGTYTVNHTVTGPGGSDSEVKTSYITVTTAPVAPTAQFTANTTSGTAPLTVQFTDLSTGNITSYAWDFTNDGTVDSTAKNATFTYSSAGTYTVNHTVTGPGGSDSEVKTSYIAVTAAPVAPVADFSVSPTSGFSPLTVQFTDTSSGTPPLVYQWDFGDGSPNATTADPVHTFTAGTNTTFTVTLTVANSAGSSSKSAPVTVSNIPSNKKGSLYVYTVPSNATIYLDGIAQGQTNLLLSNVPAGERNLTLTKPGFQTQTFLVTVPAGDMKVLPPITLKPGETPAGTTGTLWIYSNPSNATILIDGTERGYTNRFVDNVPAGLRNLTLTKPGYKAKTVMVDVPAADLKVLAPITLDPV